MKNTSDYFPKVVIGFDPGWEAQNWYGTFSKEVIYGLKNSKNKFGLGNIPQEIAKIVLNAKSEQEALGLISKEINPFINRPEMKETMSQAISTAKLRWDNVGNQYFTLLSKMLDIPISEFEEQYHAFFTFGVRCPFYSNSFMFNQYMDFADGAMHEIMHIEFLKKYKQYCLDKGLDQTQISHLKEILTILLNRDMSHLLSRPDQGYTKHQEIRPKVLEIYKKSRDNKESFVKFLDKAIALIKNVNF